VPVSKNPLSQAQNQSDYEMFFPLMIPRNINFVFMCYFRSRIEMEKRKTCHEPNVDTFLASGKKYVLIFKKLILKFNKYIKGINIYYVA